MNFLFIFYCLLLKLAYSFRSDDDCLSVSDTSDPSEGSDSTDSSDGTAPNHSDVDSVSLSDSDSIRSEEEVVEELMEVDFTL